jgi:hypothetical protein
MLGPLKTNRLPVFAGPLNIYPVLGHLSPQRCQLWRLCYQAFVRHLIVDILASFPAEERSHLRFKRRCSENLGRNIESLFDISKLPGKHVGFLHLRCTLFPAIQFPTRPVLDFFEVAAIYLEEMFERLLGQREDDGGFFSRWSPALRMDKSKNCLRSSFDGAWESMRIENASVIEAHFTHIGFREGQAMQAQRMHLFR